MGAADSLAMKVGINGFGRIGRLVFRALWGRPGIELVHINDKAGDAATAAHLLEFDSVHGRWPHALSGSADGIQVDAQSISYSQAGDPAAVPWRDAGVELVLECSGKIKTPETLEPYIAELGVQRVIVACPVKGAVAGEEVLNVVYGINHGLYDPARHRVITAASCTTNCLAPLAKVLDQLCGIEQGFLSTIHAVTASQAVVDGPNPHDPRRGRSILDNIIPTSTGAAAVVGDVLPNLQGRLTGLAFRVPVSDVSVIDLTVRTSRPTSLAAIFAACAEAGAGELQGILHVTHQPVVSCDFKGNTTSCTLDAGACQALGDSFFKLVAWYDNEAAYAQRCVDLVRFIAARG